jgi:hypothetical protein
MLATEVRVQVDAAEQQPATIATRLQATGRDEVVHPAAWAREMRSGLLHVQP